MTAPLRVGLAGLGAMGRNHLRHLSSREGCTLAAVADPAADLLADAVAKTGAAGFEDALAMINDAEIDAVVIATPTTAHAPLGLAAIERGLPVLIEKPLAGSVAEGRRARGRGPPARRAAAGGPRGAVQPSGAGAWAQDHERVARDHLLDHQPARRPIPGPHPRRRGHHRPRDARRRHPVVDRRRAAHAGVCRARAATAREPRGPPVRSPSLPVGRDRHAGRQLAHAGEASASVRGRRGRDVRARLPDPAADVHQRGRRAARR